MFNLGAVGIGHWVMRLKRTMETDGRINISKAVGVTWYEDKKAILDNFGISKDNYFRIEPEKPLPEEFFNGLDVVQIASHNKFHAPQTIQSLEHGKVTITEKTFATNRDDFNGMIDFIRSNNFAKKVTVHLHYLGKILTLELPKILSFATKEYGKITHAVGTFFEEVNPEDLRRNWLFKPDNGGILMDWIHPLEILSFICKANFEDCLGAETFIIDKDYDYVNPTGAYAKFKIDGGNFTKDASAYVRVGKGFPHGITHKTLRLVFEKDAFLDLNYISSEQEFNSDLRGNWQLIETGDSKKKIVKFGSPTGPISYHFMINDMINMINGENPSLSLDDIKRIYEPLWKFQETIANKEPKRDDNEIKNFVRDGLEKAV
ncbi:MAG: hypothetical protein HY361_03885 [Candidatus Aenigmarchaeota archaeon]|nr:hypothetical protein [Candidatus Aenigmarchaeota archaeon]